MSKAAKRTRTTRREEVKVVSIWGEEHEFYGRHYHVETTPSFPPKMLIESLKRTAKKDLPESPFRILPNKKPGGMGFQVRKREGQTDYTTRLFLVTYERTGKHFNMRTGNLKRHHKIHIRFESDSGKELFEKLAKKCFPNAVIQTHE